MKFEIKHRFTGAVLFTAEVGSMKIAVELAVKEKACLRRAYLRGADLSGADLRGADLRGAKNIPERYWTICRDDLWSVLSAAPLEVGGLRHALIDGKVDGSTYTGDCACLVGTIAKVKGCKYYAIPALAPDSNRPIEKFFSAIKAGDKPETNEFSKRAVEWIDQWIGNMELAFGGQKNAS